jgi:hypothetical protein
MESTLVVFCRSKNILKLFEYFVEQCGIIRPTFRNISSLGGGMGLNAGCGNAVRMIEKNLLKININGVIH